MEIGVILAVISILAGIFSLFYGIRISSRCSGKLRTAVVLICIVALVLVVDNVLKIFNLIPLFGVEIMRDVGETVIVILIFTSSVVFHSMLDDLYGKNIRKRKYNKRPKSLPYISNDKTIEY